jgi:hypothetical protein
MEIRHIEQSIINAINGESKLTPDILDITGMSSPRNRHLLNNLLDMPDVNYMEIGAYKGSTFISAMYQNNVNYSYVIDDWSECEDIHDDARTAFLRNCKTFEVPNYELIEINCFAIDLAKIKNKINVFFYDGNHERKLTRNSLLYYFNVLADEFLYIVDDYDWEGPSLGVADALEKVNLEVVYSRHLKSNGMNDMNTWWNGLGIFILKKR